MTVKSYAKDGISDYFWREVVRPYVLARDKFTCQEKGCKFHSSDGKGLCIHSKSGKHINSDDLITNCDSCHNKQHGGIFNGL